MNVKAAATDAPDDARTGEARSRASHVRRLRLIERAPYSSAALVTTVLFLVITVVVNPGFLTNQGWVIAAASAAPLLLMAMAETPAVLAGRAGIDLSVGPGAGLIAVVLAGVLGPLGFTAPEFLVPAALVLGMLSGAINGSLVAFVRVPPIIATLSTYLVYAGLATQLMPTPGGTVPDWLTGLASTTGPVPNVVVVFVAVGLLWWMLMRTSYRRNLLAIGGNDRAAFTAGVPVSTVRFSAYVLTGLLTGVAGLLLVAVIGGADPTIGPPYTLLAIAGMALGGVSLAGGRGGLLGPAAGGLTLFLIQNLLSFIQVSSFVLYVFYGLVLIAALLIDGSWDALRQRSRLARSRFAHSELGPTPEA
jgi:ribose transport system permease protein